MVEKARLTHINPSEGIDCACVIYGNAYSWTYVERLYNMLTRHLTPKIRFHVYTEKDRAVPAHMIKHELTEWNIENSKQAWWYKMQLFNSEHHAGPLLYFDLDVVIVRNIDWIWQSSLSYFWILQDFKYLWRPSNCKPNSSVMWWDTRKHEYVWKDFQQKNLAHTMKKYHGDQDFIADAVNQKELRFFDSEMIQSWRWQVLDGGYDFAKKLYKHPNSGTNFGPKTTVLIFHGKPKPDGIQDPVILQHWQ